MKLSNESFRTQIARFIGYRGIDMVLHLKDGSTVSLAKNRQIVGDFIYKEMSDQQGVEETIHIDDVVRADLYAT